MSPPYRHARGDRSAYDRYLRGMDASMRQKVALTAAHLLAEGRVADMGMGSGAGSQALAALYPRLDVIGVDLDPTMAELAREKHGAPNLSFVVGDIARPVFAAGSLDAVFDSSVLHHVTSFGGYRRENAADALAVQAEALRPHGVLIVRDFVDPGAGRVRLDLPDDDGDASDDPRRCSTARLFERFAREFRSLAPHPGFEYEEMPADGPAGWRRFRLSHTLAAEFVLRKDYRADWESEVREEYTYFTQDQFEDVFSRLGLRVLASTPLRNPWIVARRYRGRLCLHGDDGSELEYPPTNFVIAGEKVPPGEGVRFQDAGDAPRLGFLEMEQHRDLVSGEVRDLARRPGLTVDMLPFFEDGGSVLVLARMSYPRPIPATTYASPSLDGSRPAHYATEPLSVLSGGRPIGDTVEDALQARAGVGARAILGLRDGASYYPSPGGILEEVRSVLAEIAPVFVGAPPESVSGFTTSGRVRAVESRQLLRAAQVGGLPDARLELNVYELLLQLGRDPGPWIGEAIAMAGGASAPPPAAMSALARRPPRRRFERAGTGDGAFLDVRCRRFEERDAAGRVLCARALELVVPRTFGTNTIAFAPLWRHGAAIFIGLDDDDLPAAQAFTGDSALLVAPAWRLPRVVATITPARAWARDRLAREYGLELGGTWELGGPYRPSSGLTPETVYPLAVEALGWNGEGRPLRWVALPDAIAHRASLRDGHLRVVALRAAHALGVLSMGPPGPNASSSGAPG